jgi:3',5'-cyclic AMP phosphodiesterase CpdA
MKNFNLIFFLIMIFFAASCTKDLLPDTPDQLPDNANSLKFASAKLKIAVVSDIHYMNPSLLPVDVANNPYFQEYLAKDPKLIELSDPIFRKVMADLIVEKPDILLIPGDLTKDGELKNHDTMSRLLQKLANAGIKVLVVPGNHDINNPEALSYKGESPSPVSTVTPEKFVTLYKAFGYEDALYRDPSSLSYISQPSGNVWILAIDACKYDQNTGTSDVSGAIRPATMAWIQDKLEKARRKNITVLAMMHHGIMEHYMGQNTLDPGYVIDNPQDNALALMNAGVRFIFTGHYHANDITELTSGEKTLFDVETGSLVTPLSPYRIITLDGNYMNIRTKRVTSVNCALPGGLDFLTYSNLFLSGHLDGYFNYVLQNNYGIPEDLAGVVAPFLRNASMAHFAGDEEISPEERYKIDMLVAGGAPAFLTDALTSFWTDLPTEDNNIQLRLK